MREADVAMGALNANADALSLRDLQTVFTDIRGDLLKFVRRRTGNAEVAADLLQDVFVKLSSVRIAIPDREQARAYLFRMAGNLAIDHGRTEARRAQILQGSQVLFEDAADGPEAVAVSRSELRRIEAALDELPPKCREVLMLARIHGLEHKEIAHRLGVSVSLVEKIQLRALRHCRQRLGA
jgi:RNA polymerase sigma-70 factor (ECF subfamily)